MKLRWLCGLAILAAMGACTSSLVIVGQENLNPDQATSKPSPVTVWVYQLRGDAGFRKAGVAMIGAARATLAEDLLSEQELSISPGTFFEQKLSGADLNAETRYIGVVANFIAPEGDDWKAIVSVDEVNKKRFALNGYKIAVSAR